MKLLLLTQGLFAKVSNQDYSRANGYQWYPLRTDRRIYAMRTECLNGKQRSIYLHRFLTEAKPGEEVDHRDGDGLNNTRRNLRACSGQQNQQGFQRKMIDATSPFRGVSWISRRQKWRASLMIAKKSLNLGEFQSEKEAARAYDRAAKKYFKSFACPNFK